MRQCGTFKRWVALAYGLLPALVGRTESPAADNPVAPPPPNPPASVQTWPATARIRFAGTSTLHDFGGELPTEPFLLVISNGVWSASAKVRSAAMSTDNSKRDRRMHGLLEAAAFPAIEGRVLAAIVPGTSGGANANANTNGNAGVNEGTASTAILLRIRNQELAWPVQLTQWESTPGSLRFHAAWKLSLAAYGLQPPSVAGLIRVGDTVRLEADVTATNAVAHPGPPALP